MQHVKQTDGSSLHRRILSIPGGIDRMRDMRDMHEMHEMRGMWDVGCVVVNESGHEEARAACSAQCRPPRRGSRVSSSIPAHATE